jgi:hypothetical protein
MPLREQELGLPLEQFNQKNIIKKHKFMELLIKQGESPETFIITEVLDSWDVLGNAIKVAGEVGQHTEESVLNNILSIQSQIAEMQKSIEKWEALLLKIQTFKAEQP